MSGRNARDYDYQWTGCSSSFWSLEEAALWTHFPHLMSEIMAPEAANMSDMQA